jgi:hypothetical protein
MKNVNQAFPDDLHAEMKQAADDDLRTFTKEVEMACRFFLAARKRFGSIDHLLAALAEVRPQDR